MSELSGRELDAAVAEQVMGFTRAPEPPHRTDNRAISGVLYYLPETPWDRNQQNVVPYFSSDVAAAMQVVEKMREQGWTFELTGIAINAPCVVGNPDKQWLATFDDDARFPHPFGSYSSASALAICLAALKAIQG
jgi:hypothetical protein